MKLLQPYEIINVLKKSRVGHQYTGVSLSDLPIYIAIDENDWFSLIIPDVGRAAPQYLSTDVVTLRLSTSGTLSDGKSVMKNKKFHILQCKTTNDELTELFIILSQALTSGIKDLTNASNELISFFNSLIQLFRVSPVADLTQERQGLWGELFVLKHTGNIAFFAEHWHSEATRRFDFTSEDKRLEVKTTTRTERIHAFSHQQLFTNDKKDIVIASLVLNHVDYGLSLRELISEVRNNLVDNIQSLIKLERAIRKAGMGNPDEIGPIYDEAESLCNLAWYNVKVIPHFPQPEPQGVSCTHYHVDLSTIPKMSKEDIESWLNSWYAK